ncbi:hypothetical protein [Maribacter sp. ACAM166]|uniref:hypothetical protein n=1 Tax=Maribacter sp. ACAM166 TaxID=2508996 RepID=UPI0010FE8E45|nr:hypothetical protein [Maribacter sp. ACAM166]TLP79137.1 hypothetical protein ES765_11990 [Maribacter sp. ACAM166]
MKRINYLLVILSLTIINFSCDKFTSEEFDEVNGNVDTKLMSSISVLSAQSSDENAKIIFSYNTDNKLTTIFDGSNTTIFSYEEGSLSNVTGQSGNGNIEELYQSPYNAFEDGQVEEYDNNGNPSVLKFLEYDYNRTTRDYEVVYYTAEISYDNKPNPFYKTAEAAGLISVMDKIRLNFAAALQPEEIVKAKVLFPNNNLSQITYKNEDGEVEHSINLAYTYDGDYPTSATVTSISAVGGNTYSYNTTFSYVGN